VSIESLLRPESVVIVGASNNPQAPGGMLLEVFRQYDFRGRLYAVNPRGEDMGAGLIAHADLSSLPEVPDLCLIVVAAERVMAVLGECRAIGVKAAIVYSAPTPENPLNSEQFSQVTKDSDFRVIGPNSVGLLNVAHHLAASWSPAIDVSRGGTRPGDGPVAIVAQSGGLGFGMLSESTRRGLGVRYTISTGNEENIDCLEFAQTALEDTEIGVVVLFIEGLRSPLDLPAIGRAALEKRKALVAVKVGRSAAGQAASVLHTAHLAGSDIAYEAVFQQYGIVRADDSEEAIDCAMAMTRCPLMSTRGVGIATYSGGAGVWVADACEAFGLRVPVLDHDAQESLQAQVRTYGSVANPVDLTGPKMSANALVEAATALAAQSDIGAVVVISPMVGIRDSTRLSMDNGTQLTIDLAALQKSSGKPIIMYTYTGATTAWVEDLSNSGIAWYTSPYRLARALGALAERGESQTRWSRESDIDLRSSTPLATQIMEPTGDILLEYEVKSWLRGNGIRTTREFLVHSAAEAQDAADTLGGDVAMKAQAEGVVHKSALGLVALDVTKARVQATFEELWEAGTRATGSSPRGISVQEMLPRGIEIIIGTITDPEFGPLIMVGSGGTAAELLEDRRFRLAPISADEALRAVQELRIYRLHESSAEYDVDDWCGVADLVASVSRLAWANQQEIAGFELNPVVVLPRHQGTVVVDGTGERVLSAGSQPAKPQH
jgi:acetate---CoA ligase (ADP-forming)